MEERNQNFTVAEGYTLPSNGLIYDKDVNPRVELRAMTARDEMKRQNPSTTQFKNLADIIEGCFIEKPAIHVYDMAIGDYEYLLHKLRVVTYGEEYKIGLTCPYCGEPIDTVIYLDSLQQKDFNIDEFNEARTITLPDSGKVVEIYFSTPHLLDEIDQKVKEMKRRHKNSELNFELFVTLSTMIETVDGEKLSPTAMETFINKLSAKDLVKITNSLDKLNLLVGLDTSLTIDCPHCGGEVSTRFRFGPEFFRPTNI